MTPLRVNRPAIHARLSDVEPWIIETLLDAFEPMALSCARPKETPSSKQRHGVSGAPSNED